MNDKGELEIDKLDKLLTPKTKLVSIAHIANSTGSINPIETIIEKAHQKGSYVLIDGAQSISHLKIDVQKLNCDFYAFSSHKIYGPNGVGVLYGKKALLDKMPPFEAGGDMIDRVMLSKTTYREPPYRFEAGTPAIAEVIAFKEAFDFVEEIGIDNIALWEQKLLAYATEKISQIPGVKIIGTSHKKASILSFIVEGLHPLDIGTLLDLKGIAIRTGHHCAQPAMDRLKISGTARISLAVYNTAEEIDYFMKSLQEVISHLKK
jgi:cysteine desulfurase/selenocysteine lyase